jgi:hypothetical protein
LHPSNDYQSLNVGGEYGFQELLYLRGGYHALFLQDGEGGLSLGAGIQAELFGRSLKSRVDYGYRDFGRLKAIHVINVSVLFNGFIYRQIRYSLLNDVTRWIKNFATKTPRHKEIIENGKRIIFFHLTTW